MNSKIVPRLETKVNEKKRIKLDFSGGSLSSDAGLVLVKKLDNRLNFMEDINKIIEDPRQPEKIIHTQSELLSQRVYQIIAGYEDCSDASLLRNDPIMKLVTGKEALSDSLGSQPTLSRLENRITRRQITFLKRELVEQYIKGAGNTPAGPIILDCDSTEDSTHGAQQLTFFNGLYDKPCYHPLFIFEAHSQSLLGAHLRAGNQHPARNAHRILLPILKRLKECYPKLQIIVRADSAFGSLLMTNCCLAYGSDYVFAVGNIHDRFNSYAKPLLERAKRQYQRTKQEVVLYSSFWYSSRAWKEPRRIRVQVRVSAEAISQKFILSNLKGRAIELFKLYNQRGDCENRIKELKNGFKADRLSCHDFNANFFRLLLHCFAYQLMVLFRYFLRCIPEIASSQVDTLRLTLLKVGAFVYQKSRWVWIRLSSS